MDQITEFLPGTLRERIKRHQENLRNTTEYKAVKEFLVKIGINAQEDIIVANYNKFFDTFRTVKNCEACLGRENCNNNPPGYTAKIDPDTLIKNLAQCEIDFKYREKLRINRLLESSRVPELFKNKNFNNFEVNDSNKPPYDIAMKFCMESGSKGIVFSGTPGIGKTHLAAAILNYKLNKGQECIFCTVPELLSDIRRVIKSEQETSELMELVKNSEFLTLDDLGAEKTTEWVAEQLFVIINARLVRNKLTVITTNYQRPSDLIDKLGGGITGQRIVSRIREMCQWVNMIGSDYRLK